MHLATNSVHAFAPHVGPLRGRNSSPCTGMWVCKLLRKWHGEATPRENPTASKNLSRNFSPPLGSIQRSVHRFSHLGVFVWQSDVDVADCISVEVGSTHVSGGDQGKVLDVKKRLPDTRHREELELCWVSSRSCPRRVFDSASVEYSNTSRSTNTVSPFDEQFSPCLGPMVRP